MDAYGLATWSVCPPRWRTVGSSSRARSIWLARATRVTSSKLQTLEQRCCWLGHAWFWKTNFSMSKVGPTASLVETAVDLEKAISS